MLRVGPWNRLPLTVRWLNEELARDFPVIISNASSVGAHPTTTTYSAETSAVVGGGGLAPYI